MKKLPLSLLGLIFTLFATTASAQVAQQARNFQIDATHTGAITTDHTGWFINRVITGLDLLNNFATDLQGADACRKILISLKP